ncbi:serine protease Hayan isoform X2 [Bactrocera oleae]|uniref:serine protease Hayan isoform X2 n=1 Tax=Bactrocera oleae TaxID=104688 RepID=UPI00387E28D4
MEKIYKPSMQQNIEITKLTFLLVLLFAKEICSDDTSERFIIYMDVHNDIENLIQWGNTCEAKLTTLEQTVVETTESRESSNEKYLETLKKLEYLEHTVSTYELKQTAAEHTIQSLISRSKQIEEELRHTIHILSAKVTDLASKFALQHRDPLPERVRPFKTPSTTGVQRRPIQFVPPVQYVPPTNVPTAASLVSQVCEEIERALQLEGIKRFVSGIHPSLTIIERKTRYSSVFRCMGSLIGKRFVLTSGRCVYTGGANFVRLGIRSDKTSAIGMNIKKMLIHPKYALGRKFNIAVIELEGDVEYSSLVYPTCLYTAATISITNAEVFYIQDLDEFSSKKLEEVRGRLVPYSNCARFAEVQAQDSYEESLICVHYNNVSDSYYSSFHGPLFFTQKDVIGKERIIAVYSENSLRNDVYMTQELTKVYDYLDFIENAMRSLFGS